MEQLNRAIEGVADFRDFMDEAMGKEESPARRVLREAQERRLREQQERLEAAFKAV